MGISSLASKKWIAAPVMAAAVGFGATPGVANAAESTPTSHVVVVESPTVSLGGYAGSRAPRPGENPRDRYARL